MRPLKWYLQGFKQPGKGLWVIIENWCTRHIKNDKVYLSIKSFLLLGYPVNWKNPKTFNAKLNWLKLYNRKPIYTTMVDKVEAKKYVAERIGEEYIIPTYGVWDRPEDIDFDSLPDQFVLKCNHAGSQGMCICKDKSKLDYDAVRAGLAACLKDDY